MYSTNTRGEQRPNGPCASETRARATVYRQAGRKYNSPSPAVPAVVDAVDADDEAPSVLAPGPRRRRRRGGDGRPRGRRRARRGLKGRPGPAVREAPAAVSGFASLKGRRYTR